MIPGFVCVVHHKRPQWTMACHLLVMSKRLVACHMQHRVCQHRVWLFVVTTCFAPAAGANRWLPPGVCLTTSWR